MLLWMLMREWVRASVIHSREIILRSIIYCGDMELGWGGDSEERSEGWEWSLRVEWSIHKYMINELQPPQTD